MFDKSKTLGATMGVIVAIFLIGQQTGIFIFLTDLMKSLVANSEVDIWVVGENVNDVNSLSAIDFRNGKEIRSVKGVKNVNPLIVSGSSMKLPNGKSTPVRIIGSLAPTFTGGPWNIVHGNLNDMITQGGIGADKFDLRTIGDVKPGDQVSVGGKLVELRVITKGARGFGSTNVFTNLELARELGNFSNNKVSAFLVNVNKGYAPNEVAEIINNSFTGIKAMTKKRFSRSTVIKILKDGAIGESLGSLILFAIVAGGVIIGLTLYSAAIDRIDDYATMKAIGAQKKLVTKIILLQSVIISLIGFAIGSMLIIGFKFAVQSSGLKLAFSWHIWIIFFLLTLTISVTGAYFASKSIRKVEPSKVF